MSLDLAKRIDMIQSLYEINKAISSSLSHDLIIATAADHIEVLLNCDLQVIADKHLGSQRIMSVRGGDKEITKRLTPGQELENKGIIHHAVTTEEIQYIPDTGNYFQPCRFLQDQTDNEIRSLMIVPLVTSKGVRGLLILGDRQPAFFRNEELFVVSNYFPACGSD
jgi:transcriptional regulator with GAF, ATPase, and Fis domain